MNNHFISIVIPTYNDWARLSLCIDALDKQTLSKDMFEVIIVNNNPNDPMPADIHLPSNVRLIVEEAPGSYAARNAALKIAKGNIIGFTDSDCIPDKNWIKNASIHFRNNSTCSRIAGNVVIFFESSRPSKAEVYDKIFAFNQKNYVQSSGTSVTANMFTYRNVFNAIGLFSENLMSGGDFLWGTVANKKGFKIDYVDNVIVNHPGRKSLQDLIKKEKRVGGSQAIFLVKNRGAAINLIKFIKELRPRIGALKWIVNTGRELSANDKLYILLLRHYLLIVRAYERLRVQMGKQASRE